MGKFDFFNPKPKPRTKNVRVIVNDDQGPVKDLYVEVEFIGTAYSGVTDIFGNTVITLPWSAYACNVIINHSSYEPHVTFKPLGAVPETLIHVRLVKVPVIIEPEPNPIVLPSTIVRDGRFFKYTDGTVFRWRAITWFRFLEQVKNGEDLSYLDVLREMGFNILRVLSTATWFGLSPEEGREVLAKAKEIAYKKGFYLEVVAVVDSGVRDYDWKYHARRIAEICAEGDYTTFYEFANEPGHGVQSEELHNLAACTRFAEDAVRGLNLNYSAGSWGTDEPGPNDTIPHPVGNYLTPHLDRGRDKWNQVRRVRELEALNHISNRPVINDEPIGFDELDGSQTGRQRFNDPDIALTFGVLSRIMEVGTTFHCQSGLKCEELGPVQLKCAQDFILGTKLVPDNSILRFKNVGWVDSPIASYNESNCIRVYSGLGDGQIVIALGLTGDPEIVMKNGYVLGERIIDRDAVKVWRLV